MYISRVRIRPGLSKSSHLPKVLAANIYGPHRLLWDLFPNEKHRTFLYREEIARKQLRPLPVVRGEPIYYMVSKTRPVEAEDSLFHVETKNYNPRLRIGQRLGFECRVNPVVTRQGKKHDIVMDAQLRLFTSLIKACRLESSLSARPEKREYKKLLLERGGEPLDKSLTDILGDDPRHTGRLREITGIADQLAWAVKARIDSSLENWLKKQSNRFGFSLIADDRGFAKLQNSAYRWHHLSQKARKGDKSGFSSVDLTGELAVVDVDKFTRAIFGGVGRAKAFGCGLMLIRRVM